MDEKNNSSDAVASPLVAGRTLAHAPGAKLEVFEYGRWVPCTIVRIASYVGKSGPGYDAAYDPPRSSCTSFWCHDRALRARSAITAAEGK